MHGGALDPGAAARGLRLPAVALGTEAAAVGALTWAGLGAGTPMAWFDALDVTEFGFKPLKHRKFVERVAGAPDDFRDVLPFIHDARFATEGEPGPAFLAGLQAAREWVAAHAAAASQQAPTRAGDGSALALDLHGFHTAVVPPPAKKQPLQS